MRIMMKKDEIPRTPFAKYPEGLIIDNYKEVAINMLHLNYPTLSLGEISAAVDWSISKHFKDSEAVINNNYKKVNIDTTLLKLTDFHNSGSKYFSALYLTFYFILCKLYALEI